MARYVVTNNSRPPGSCHYCGWFGGSLRPDTQGRIAHASTVCLHCGTRVCMAVHSKCPRCYTGLLAGWSGHSGSCERARCEQPRVAYVRRRYICAAHAGPPVIPDQKVRHYAIQWVEVPDELEDAF